VGVVIGGPFNSGVLARAGGTFNYAAAPPEVLERVERLRAVCGRYGVDLPAAALQFAAAHPAVVSVIPGAQTPQEVAANAAMVDAPLPPELWAALRDEGLVDLAAPTPALETT
jgi:D-threo-aldose 1-dehydrogenase